MIRRIALATSPFPKSIEDAMTWVEAHSREAAVRGAEIVCFPESYVPGMRAAAFEVGDHRPEALEIARQRACDLARELDIAIVLPMDWDHPEGIRNVAFVISRHGEVIGCQTKNQLDPSEDETFVPGHERQLFELDGLIFGVAICHEGFRYPESVRWAASRGAVLVFNPHCTGNDREGTQLSEWRAKTNPYNESAMVCRAMENEIYFAGVNYALKFQESATCMISPSGECIAHQPYGDSGVLVVEIDPATATRQLAIRYRSELYD